MPNCTKVKTDNLPIYNVPVALDGKNLGWREISTFARCSVDRTHDRVYRGHMPNQLCHLALGVTAFFWVGCGDSGTTETDGTTGSLVCEEPDFYEPTEPDMSCGCYKEDYKVDPWYIHCVGEACVDGQCGGFGETKTCLWDGVVLYSGGSFCAEPCGAQEKCPVVDGVQTVCAGVYCIIPCAQGCPKGMFCVETPAGGIGELYCIYDYRPF